MATGTWNSRGGFTLLELLVVLAIVGILVAAISLATSSRSATLRIEARRLAALMELAREEAILRATTMAMTITATGYGFQEQDEDGSWRAGTGVVFRPRRLPGGMAIVRLTLDSEPVDLTDPEIDRQPPRLFFLTSGETTPAELELADLENDSGYRILTDADGVIRWEEASPGL